MWWPDDATPSTRPWTRQSNFPILGLKCPENTTREDCCPNDSDCKSSGNACVWLHRENRCSPKGLWVNDANTALELDTGSSIIALSPDYCQKHNLTTTGTIVPESYGSTPNADPSPTEYPHTLLGVLTHPTCTKKSLAGVPHGGLVGLRPAATPSKISHSLMDTFPSGERTVTVDKEHGTVCFGTNCPSILADRDMEQFVYVGKRPLLGFQRDGKYILIDTGSTQTWKMNDEICILGNNDIKSLHVDYDNNAFKYDIDEENIDIACGPSAKAGNWNA